VIRREDLKRARAIQAAVSEQFLAHLRGGLAVIGFERTDQAGVYLVGEWPSA